MQPITIAIFDDHPLIIDAISSELKKNELFKIVFTANNKLDFHSQLQQSIPDVLILDIIADEVLGLELFLYILTNFHTCKIIAHSSLSSPHLVDNLLGIGVHGYVSKKQPISVLIQAIETVYQNKIFVTTEYQFLTSQYQTAGASLLTNREIEIVNSIGAELTSQQIADKLYLSVNTIESHRKRIFQKLNVKNVAGMIREAGRLGYLKEK